MSRTTGNRPAFLQSAVHAELLAAFIWDAAERTEAENGHGTQTGATVRMARSAAREILSAAGMDKLTQDKVLAEPERADLGTTETGYQ